jgi:hypothetical protein
MGLGWVQRVRFGHLFSRDFQCKSPSPGRVVDEGQRPVSPLALIDIDSVDGFSAAFGAFDQ